MLRPERLGKDSRGIVTWPPDVMSPQVLLEQDSVVDPDENTHLALGIAPDPTFLENPFRSNQDGEAQVNGTYETYVFYIYYAYNREVEFVMRKARVIVGNPKSRNAFAHRAEMLTAPEFMRDENGQSIRGIEPTITADGRLLVYQGHPNNDGSISYLMYTFNPTVQAGGWTRGRSITDLYYVDRNRMVDGIPFHEHYPIAKMPLKDSLGVAYRQGELYYGAYPWLSFDGAEISHTSIDAGCADFIPECEGQPGTRALRGGFAFIGRWTNWAMKHVDGPANPSRLSFGPTHNVRTATNALGSFPGMWEAFRDVADLPIPYTGQRPLYSMIGAVSGDYVEVSFEDSQDRNYLLFWRMNELVKRSSDKQYNEIDPSTTPDTSGNFLHGKLNNAHFPIEYDGVDRNIGANGQAVFFPDLGSVRASNNSKFGEIAEGFTIEMFLKRLVDMSGDGTNRYRIVANKSDSFNLIVEVNGQIQGTVFTKESSKKIQEYRTGAVGSGLSVGQWVHVAMSFDALTGQLRAYQDGILVHEQQVPAFPVNVTSSPFVIGPGGQVKPPWGNTDEALFAIDEVKLSRRVRSPEEIRVSAFKNSNQSFYTNALNLPLGLNRNELKIPFDNIPNDLSIALGERLFHDTRLSRNNDMACATCHKPDQGFTDGLARANGFENKMLRRNTQTIFNRAFSLKQFWDGRASSLEDQALKPISNPAEMNLPIEEALSRIAEDSSYIQAFQQTYGEGVSERTVAMALASFERSALRAGSRVDLFNAGDSSALSESEIRGRALFMSKARCISCHSGSNYTDENFHNTGFVCTDDFGLEESSFSIRDRRFFKTPSLRVISATGPYMHDGSFPNLESVVETYNQGGKFKDNLDTDIRPLNLSTEEKADLVNFLKAL